MSPVSQHPSLISHYRTTVLYMSNRLDRSRKGNPRRLIAKFFRLQLPHPNFDDFVFGRAESEDFYYGKGE